MPAHTVLAVAVLATALAWPMAAAAQSWTPASPGGVFATIFGSAGPFAPRDARAVPVMAYAPPGSPGVPGLPGTLPPGVTPPEAPPAATAYCVRLCDGRFFPLSAPAAISPAKLCSAFCPASRTKVFEGAGIDQATAPDGSRYASLATAHLYRKELVAGCTCNGRDAFGLAKVDIANDPTLRAGDVVATRDGLKVFQGAGGTRHRAADFTPIRRSPLVSDDLRRKLRGLRVAKDLGAPKRGL
ncbi:MULTISPECIES: DUF2865 domain-containing protein [Rhodoplanes]|uniref:DUF2865 domain-containing protein n=1 Tax=Rhodoplanes TaxID=29407 RepID=UPI0023500A1B|nr:MULTISPECIES: DUF2865 domain-containing protein [Rhodoplanes]